MSKLAITGVRILDPEASAPAPSNRGGERGVLLVEEGRIAGRLPLDALEGTGPAALGPDWGRVARDGHWLAPGLLDLHFHGELVACPRAEYGAALERASRRLLRSGTTGFLATTVTGAGSGLAEDVAALAAAASALAGDGAACLGLHLEGPWISSAAPGAMAPAGIRPFDPRRDTAVLDAAEGGLRMVTLAPEVSGAGALLAELAARGAVAALGHTRAEPAAIAEGVAEGLRHVTHLFNAMGPLHHREPGVPGTVLADERLSCDLICDGYHVHPAVVRIAAQVLGERLMLISDRLDPPGAAPPPAASDTALGRIASAGCGEPWRRADGTLAGSRLALDRAIANLRAFAEVSLREAVAACTLRPARLLGIESERGTLRRGARADFAVLDAGGAVVETWLAGRPAWSAERGDADG